jgi:hypothetical protein
VPAAVPAAVHRWQTSKLLPSYPTRLHFHLVVVLWPPNKTAAALLAGVCKFLLCI